MNPTLGTKQRFPKPTRFLSRGHRGLQRAPPIPPSPPEAGRCILQLLRRQDNCFFPSPEPQSGSLRPLLIGVDYLQVHPREDVATCTPALPSSPLRLTPHRQCWQPRRSVDPD